MAGQAPFAWPFSGPKQPAAQQPPAQQPQMQWQGSGAGPSGQHQWQQQPWSAAAPSVQPGSPQWPAAPSGAAPWANPGSTYATEPWAHTSLNQPVPAQYAAWPTGQQQQPQQTQFQPGWQAAANRPPAAALLPNAPRLIGQLPQDHQFWRDTETELRRRGLWQEGMGQGTAPQAAPTGAAVRLPGPPAPLGINQAGFPQESSDPLGAGYQMPGDPRHPLVSDSEPSAIRLDWDPSVFSCPPAGKQGTIDFEQQLFWAKGHPVLPRGRFWWALGEANQVLVAPAGDHTTRQPEGSPSPDAGSPRPRC